MNALWDSFTSILELDIECQQPRHDARLAASEAVSPLDQDITLVEFVERRFIPEYLSKKRVGCRAHFQAILKHIVPPERVTSMFAGARGKSKFRLKTVPGWPYMDTVRLCEVTPETVQRLISAASNSGYSTQTIIHLRNVIRSIFSYATGCGYYSHPNPTAHVSLPAVASKSVPAITMTQLKQVIDLMRYPEKYLALFVLLTDMTVAEICGLKWKCVNLSRTHQLVDGEQLPSRTIAVKTRNYRGEYGPLIRNHSRVIPIQELLYSILNVLRDRDRFTAAEDFVLESRRGTPINPDNLAARRLKAIGNALAMPWLSWTVFYNTRKSLRASFGRYLNREFEHALALKPR